MKKLCGASQNAPCLLPTTIAYPGALGHFLVGGVVKLLPEVNGSHPTSFTITPALPDGLILDSNTGEIHGTFTKDYKDNGQKYTITANNHVVNTETTSQIKFLMKPATLIYQLARAGFSPGGTVKLLPEFTGGRPSNFTINPTLPAGLKLDSNTGEIQGVISKDQNVSDQNVSDLKFVVTARNTVGETTAEIELSIEPRPTGFPWWIESIIAVIVMVLVVVAIFLCRKPARAKMEDAAYVPLRPALYVNGDNTYDNKPVEPAPAGLPLTWYTGRGEQTVYATRKPLNLQYEKVLPIKITYEKEGHGKEIGIKATWVLKSVNNMDITGCSNFKEANALFLAEVNKLPGGIPLTWGTGSGDVTVWATIKPLSLKFDKELPITIYKVKEGHGKEIGIQVGWFLKSINGVDVTRKTNILEAVAIFRDEISKLPDGEELSQLSNEWPSPSQDESE